MNAFGNLQKNCSERGIEGGMAPLRVRNFNQSITSRSHRVYSLGYLLQFRLDKTPLVSAENHDGNLAACWILLERKVFVRCDQEIEPSLFRRYQQLTIQKSAPALLICGLNGVPLPGILHPDRSSLVEKDEHQRVDAGASRL